MSVESLSKAKEKKADDAKRKAAEQIVKDCEQIQAVLGANLDALMKYRNYVHVMEILSVIQTSRSLNEITMRKFRIIADGKKD